MKRLSLVILCSLCSATFARGGEPMALADSINSRQTIDEVVVSGSRVALRTIPAQVLDKESIERLSVHSVADAIRYFSGAQIKDYGGVGGLKTVNIRSMGSQHVGVFYDGVALSNAQNGVVDLGRFSLENMESLSMYSGQKSAIFQSAKDFASAGSIYMRSRTPRFTTDKNYSLRATFKTGSFGLVNPSLLLEQRISESLSASLSGEYLQSNGKYKFTYSKADGYKTTAVRQNGDLRAVRAEAGLYGSIANGEWRTKLYLYDSERGYPGAYVRSTGEFQNQDRQWDTNIFGQASLRKGFTQNYSLLLTAKYSYDFLRYFSDPALNASAMYIDNEYTQQEVYISAANQFIIKDWWSANLSVDYAFNELDATLTAFSYPRRHSLLGAAATSINVGRLRAQASLLYSQFVDTNSIVEPSYSNDLSPTLLVAYQPFEQSALELRAFYKHIFRMPTLGDLYYVTSTLGASDLEPERTTQYNLGATYGLTFAPSDILQSFDFQADIYYNEVDDKIIAMPTNNQFRWTMLNLGYVEIRGVDLATQVALLVGGVELNTRLAYTAQSAVDLTDKADSYYGDQIPYIPWHSGSLVVGARHRGWELNYSFIYTGCRYESQENIAENYAQPWYTHDIALFKELALRGHKLRAGVEANNLLNQQYEVVRCYPMPGTNIRITINFTL